MRETSPAPFFGPFDDPARATGNEEEIMVEFRRVRDQIRARIAAFASVCKPDQ
jgi:hypothetical protein